MISITDLFKLIPDHLKQSAIDALVETVVSRGEGLISQTILSKIEGLRSDASFRQQIDVGLQKGLQRFINEYQLQDEDLVAAIASDVSIFSQPEVKQALLIIVQKPSQYLTEEQDLVGQSFTTILPQRINRQRVDRAITYLLRCLAQELWHMPEFQPIYSLEFQRITAESTHEQLAVQKAQLAALNNLNADMRDALLQLTNALTEQKLLPVGQSPSAQSIRSQSVFHNLSQPDHGEFVGREKEIQQIFKLLQPYPRSRHHLIVIDGIGGIGKSTLAMEIAHRCLYTSLQAIQKEHSEQDSLVKFRQILIERFNEDELRTLCFDMALDYDMLPGRDKGGKSRELVSFLQRRNRMNELEEYLKNIRPNIPEFVSLNDDSTQELTAEIFDAIVWTSAKQTILSAEGIEPRYHVLHTLDDIYTAIANTLQREDINHATSEEQANLIRNTKVTPIVKTKYLPMLSSFFLHYL